MKSIYITGGNGLLSSNLIQYLSQYRIRASLRKYENIIPRINYDIINSSNYSSLKNKILKFKPDVIIHTAGITDIEKCEKYPIKARQSNLEYSKKIAKISSLLNCKLIYISTDHLYNDQKKIYSENDITNPINEYAKSKFLSEISISKLNKKSIILRTNFFDWGPVSNLSFLDKIYNNLSISKEVFLFDDVYFNPVSISFLTKVIENLINKNVYGIFNISSNKPISKYSFGLKIAETFNLNKKLIKPISINDKKLVKRPKFLSLSNKKLKKNLEINVPSIKKMLLDLKVSRKNNKNVRILPYGLHHLDESDIKSVAETMINGNLTQGNQVSNFENVIKKYVGVKYAVAVSSCTAGLHLCSIVSGLNSKNSFVTSPISFVSTSNAGLYQKSNPIFIDIDPDTVSINTKELLKILKVNKNIKTIFPVHFAGNPINLREIYKYSKKNNQIIIEDAAHALGAKYEDGSKVGSCKNSDMCVFSFHPVKIAAAGEGGVITTNNKNFYRQLLRLRSHGINKNDDIVYTNRYAYDEKRKKNVWYYEMQELGFHYRITDLQSSLAISQMSKIDKFLKKRIKLVKKYIIYLKKFKNCKPYQSVDFDLSSNHIFIVKINFKKIGISRNALMKKLKILRIGTQVHYLPIFLQRYYKKFNFKASDYPNSISYYNNCLTLPLYYDLSFKEQKYLIDQLYNIIE